MRNYLMVTSMKKLTLMAIVFYSISLGAWVKPVFAENYEDADMMIEHHDKRFKRMINFLDLTEQQVLQMKQLRESAQIERQTFKSELAQFKTQVEQLSQAQEFDEQAFNNLYVSYQDTFAKMALARAKHKHQMAQILTDEQREKAQKMRHKRKQGFRREAP